jgi:hypothetical protein
MLVFHSAFYLSSYVLPRDPKKGSGPTKLWTEQSLTSLSVISFPRIPACPGTQYSPTVCQVKLSFTIFWHCLTNGDVLEAWSVFRATWLSEQTLTYFSGLFISFNFKNTG